MKLVLFIAVLMLMSVVGGTQTPPQLQLCLPSVSDTGALYHKVEFRRVHNGQEFFSPWSGAVIDTVLDVPYTLGDSLFARLRAVDAEGGVSEWSDWSAGYFYAGVPVKPAPPSWNCIGRHK